MHIQFHHTVFSLPANPQHPSETGLWNLPLQFLTVWFYIWNVEFHEDPVLQTPLGDKYTLIDLLLSNKQNCSLIYFDK